MDDVATVAEQVLGVLTWREPRVTFVATCALMSASVGYFFSHVVFDVVVAAARLYASTAAARTNRAATSVVGKVVETVTERANAVWERYFEHAYATLEHAVVSSTRETVGAALYVWSFFTPEAVFRALRFAASAYMLYALRHPSVFPDESAAFKNAAKSGGPGVDEASEADRKEGSNANAKGGDEEGANGDAAGKENAPPEEEPPRKKSKAELEAEAERERRRAARAAKKAERRKAKEAEEEAKKVKAEGASMIDPRPTAPVNALLRIPSRSYQIL
jgi:signal transduction histidine kinase